MKASSAVRYRMLTQAAVTGALLWFALPTTTAAKNAFFAAMESITADELGQHVDVLADDVYEGRLAGSRGGRAAGQYVVQELRQYTSLTPAGTDGDYYQPFDKGDRNILVFRPGTDPVLQNEVVVVGAHYDHVGDGSRGHAMGPIGKIYNGADDNASGVAVLLETIEAVADTPLDTRRSILFAFWDAEELGMIGSRHWLEQPTIDRQRIKLAINADMVGRLREGKLQVLGTRTGYGLRRLFSEAASDPLWLDFSWEMQANSDHWSFMEHDIPSILFHTGLHPDYHRPTDDADKINRDGMREVGQYLLAVLAKVADADQLPAFRAAGMRENESTQRRQEQVPRPVSLDRWPRNLPPPRLGISWRGDDAEPGAVVLTSVVGGTPAAAAGLAALDRIYAVNEQPFANVDEFHTLIHRPLDAGVPEFTLTVESRGQVRTVTVAVPSSPPAESP